MTHQQKILFKLLDGLPHSNLEMSNISLRYSSRLCELRKLGFDIFTIQSEIDFSKYDLPYRKKGGIRYYVLLTPSKLVDLDNLKVKETNQSRLL